MAMLDEVLGALVIGQWINYFLYCAELMCAYRYFSDYKQDHIVLKAIIVFMVCCDTCNTILQSIIVYNMSVRSFGNFAALAEGTLYFALQCLLPSTTALICQLFLVWRFARISSNYWLSGLLALPPLGAWISAVYATVALLVYTSLEDRLRVVDIGTSWLSLEAASDILISTALIILLAKYTRKTTFKETQSMLRRLMFNAFRTGAVTASIAIAMLMAFLLSKTSNINTGFSFVLGRTYALTLFVNLLIRPKSGENENGSAENYSYTYGRSTGSRKQPFGVNSYKLNNVSRTQAETAQIGTVNYGGAQGIAVSKEIQVKIDQPIEKEDLRGYESSLEREQYELEKVPRAHANF